MEVVEVPSFAPRSPQKARLARKPGSGLKRKPGALKRTTAPRKVSSKKPKKPPTLPQLKKKLDTLFSIYIRAKYPKKCFTCGNTGVRLQNGHFVTRMYLATRWDEDNCRPQCRVCNCLRQGMVVDFEEGLIRELGTERVQELKDSRKELRKLNEAWYLEQIAHYKVLVDNASKES